MNTIPHHVQHVIHHAVPIIHIGYTGMELLVSNLLTAAIAAGLAWYIRGRGITGVQVDINNIKADVENLKNKVQAHTA